MRKVWLNFDTCMYDTNVKHFLSLLDRCNTVRRLFFFCYCSNCQRCTTWQWPVHTMTGQRLILSYIAKPSSSSSSWWNVFLKKKKTSYYIYIYTFNGTSPPPYHYKAFFLKFCLYTFYFSFCSFFFQFYFCGGFFPFLLFFL